MKKLIILLLLIPAFSFAGITDTHKKVIAQKRVAGGETCVGFNSTNCVPDENPTGANVSANADRTYCYPWTATGAGTATKIKMYNNTGVNASSRSWVVLFSGTTLIGYALIPTSTTTGQWNEFTLTVVGGQSLTFAQNDALCFGWQYDYDTGGITDGAQGATTGSVNYDFSSDTPVGAAPVDVNTFTASGNTELGVILVYE